MRLLLPLSKRSLQVPPRLRDHLCTSNFMSARIYLPPAIQFIMAMVLLTRAGAAFLRPCQVNSRMPCAFPICNRASPRTASTKTKVGVNFQHDQESSSSVDFSLEPSSEEARDITSRLGLNTEQHETLSELSSLVVEWNEKINLVSRKDCTRSVVFGRHVLPSVAMTALPQLKEKRKPRIIDIGTGGGFPGLPLAIAYPDAKFMLLDSVGKKVKVVQAMAEELGLDNVQTHHGRAEELVYDEAGGHLHKRAYDICVGRSVAALPKFCFWTSSLLKRQANSKLLYIIGGDVDNAVLSQAQGDVAIEDLLQYNNASDKRILVFSRESVKNIAAASGEKKQKRGKPKLRSNPRRTQRKPKGEWDKKDNKIKKQRGYDDFKRYDG